MSNSLDERDYREKNTWRRWVWNRITERLSRRTDRSTVLYLAAADNLDASVAIKKGFDARNLVAIDRDPQKVKRLRTARVLAICDDALDVAMNFGRPVDVIHYDFCCGLHDELATKLLTLLLMPHTRDAVFSLNFLRGRDQSSNYWRLSPGSDDKPPQLDLSSIDIHGERANCHKNRGLQFALLHLHEIVSAAESKMPESHLTRMRITTTSYKSSSNQVFDSVVFVGLGRGMNYDADNDAQMLREYRNLETVARVSAFRAVQTMRSRKSGSLA